MAENPVFDATIQAVDRAAGPIAAVAARFRGLGQVIDGVGHHWHGLGHVLEAAFGEGEHAAHHAAGEVRKAAASVRHVADAAGQAAAGMHGAAAAAGQMAHGAAAAAGEMRKAGQAAQYAGQQIQHAAHGRGWAALAGHISLLRGHFGSLNVAVGEVGNSISEFLPALGALGAAGGLVGLFELTEHAADAYSELNKAATIAGVTATQFAELSHAAKMTDVPVEAMSTGLFRLNRVIADSAGGKNKDATALFHHLGVSVRDANGHLRSAAELMPELAAAFQHTTDPAMRARMAMALFGRGGAEMLPLLMQGREELEKFARESDRVNFVPKGEEAEQLESYHRSIVTLGEAVSGFANAIGAKLAPVLAPIVQQVTEWVTANREWIATAIAAKVEQLAHWVERLNLHEIVTQTLDWAHWLADLSAHVGGVNTAIGAMVLVIGSPLLGGVRAVIEIIGTLMTVMRSFAILMLANPILLAVAAVAVAIGIAAYEIWQHWDWVKQHFTATWDDISRAFSDAWTGTIEWVSRQLRSAADWISSAWQGTRQFFQGVWEGVSQAFSSAWEYIRPTIIDPLNSAPLLVADTWAILRNFFGSLWDSVCGAFDAAWEFIRPTVILPLNAAALLIVDSWTTLKDFFVSLWQGIKQAFADAWAYIQPIIQQLKDAANFIENGWVGRELGLGGADQAHPGDHAPETPKPYRRSFPHGTLQPLPQLYGPGGAAAPTQPGSPEGRVKTDITIRVQGAPNSTVNSTASGIADYPHVDVGYSGLAGAHY